MQLRPDHAAHNGLVAGSSPARPTAISTTYGGLSRTGGFPAIDLPTERQIPIAALFVASDGAYSNLDGVETWDEARDARGYAGPWPVVAHPPCQAWGRYAASHPIKGSRYRKVGEDGGCFAAALAAVRRWGGVIEHPKDSKAFGCSPGFSLGRPAAAGWIRSDDGIGWLCQVEQGHEAYGHFSRKPTWLYAVGVSLPDLIWGRAEQRLPAYAVERYGYEKARRIGVMAAVGGKRKTEIREATPEPFRDLLLSVGLDRPRAPRLPDRRAVMGREIDFVEADACAERGRIVWHTSEPDGGPDVGRSLGLGDGWMLWFGEISRQAWEDAGTDAADLGDDFGTWIILYGPKPGDMIVIGKAVDGYVGEDLLGRIAMSIVAQSSSKNRDAR